MTADDVVYTFQQLSDPKNASNALSTFTGVLDARRASRRSTPRRSRSTSRRPTATSPTWSRPTTTTRSSSPRAPTSPSGRRRSSGTGPFKLESYTQNVGASSCRTPTTGATEAAAGRQPVHVLRQPAADDPGAAGRRRRRDRPVRAGRAPTALLNNSTVQDHQAQVGQPPRAVDAQRPAAVHRPARPPGGRATRSTGPGWCGAAQRQGRASATTSPFAPRYPVDRHRASRSAPRTSPRPSSCCRPPGTATASSPTLITEQYQEIPQLAQVIKRGRRRKVGDQHQPQRRDARPAYYGKATFGNSDWLDGTMSLVDYGDRGVAERVPRRRR